MPLSNPDPHLLRVPYCWGSGRVELKKRLSRPSILRVGAARFGRVPDLLIRSSTWSKSLYWQIIWIDHEYLDLYSTYIDFYHLKKLCFFHRCKALIELINQEKFWKANARDLWFAFNAHQLYISCATREKNVDICIRVSNDNKHSEAERTRTYHLIKKSRTCLQYLKF